MTDIIQVNHLASSYKGYGYDLDKKNSDNINKTLLK